MCHTRTHSFFIVPIAGFLIEVNGEDDVRFAILEVFLVLVEDALTFLPDNVCILAITIAVYHQRILDACTSNTANSLYISIRPEIFLIIAPFAITVASRTSHPLVSDIHDTIFLLSDDCIFDSYPVVGSMEEHILIITATRILYVENTDEMIVLARLDQTTNLISITISSQIFLSIAQLDTQGVTVIFFCRRECCSPQVFLPSIRIVIATHQKLLAVGIKQSDAIGMETRLIEQGNGRRITFGRDGNLIPVEIDSSDSKTLVLNLTDDGRGKFQRITAAAHATARSNRSTVIKLDGIRLLEGYLTFSIRVVEHNIQQVTFLHVDVCKSSRCDSHVAVPAPRRSYTRIKIEITIRALERIGAIAAIRIFQSLDQFTTRGARSGRLPNRHLFCDGKHIHT